MTYEEARAFLAGLVNYEQQSPSASDLALGPIRALLGELGDPHQQLAIVHVAGTNGKGSVAIILDEILKQAGYRTGRYTTPSLCEFEDQICVCGIPISRSACADYITKIHRAIARGGASASPTHFDVVTAMAFMHFASVQVDVAIIEVGMGGQNDSTNICSPILSIITSIDYDHTSQLGPSLRSIAQEKAGIVKPGRPVVSGAIHAEARDVIRAACAGRNAPLSQLGVDMTYEYVPGRISETGFVPPYTTVVTPRRRWPLMALNLLGKHQAANAALAVRAVEQLQDIGFRIPDEAVRQSLAYVRCPARTEMIMERPLVVLDCSHNPASIDALIATLSQSFPNYIGEKRIPHAKRRLIFGASRDKNISAMLKIIAGHFDSICFTSSKRSRRSANQTELQAALRASGCDLPYRYVETVSAAFEAIVSETAEVDFICITGSVFLAGEFLASQPTRLLHQAARSG